MSSKPVPPRGRSLFRQADMVKAMRSAKEFGLEISGVEITKDGTIRVVAKSADPKIDTPENIIGQL